MPEPAGYNAVVLFFSMNRYMSVGGTGRVSQQKFPSPVPAFVQRITWKPWRQSRKTDSVTQRGQEQSRHENVIKERKGRAERIITRRSRVGFCFWNGSYFPCSVTHATLFLSAFCTRRLLPSELLEQPVIWFKYKNNKTLDMGCPHCLFWYNHCWHITVYESPFKGRDPSKRSSRTV